MVIDMDEAQVRTLEQVRQVVTGTQALEFRRAEGIPSMACAPRELPSDNSLSSAAAIGGRLSPVELARLVLAGRNRREPACSSCT